MKYIDKQVLLSIISQSESKQNLLMRKLSPYPLFEELRKLITRTDPDHEIPLHQVLWWFIENPPAVANFKTGNGMINVASNPVFEALCKILQSINADSIPACAVMAQFIALHADLVKKRLSLHENVELEPNQLLTQNLDNEATAAGNELVDLAALRSLAVFVTKSLSVVTCFMEGHDFELGQVSESIRILQFIWANIFKQKNETELLVLFSKLMSGQFIFSKSLSDISWLKDLQERTDLVELAAQIDTACQVDSLLFGYSSSHEKDKLVVTIKGNVINLMQKSPYHPHLISEIKILAATSRLEYIRTKTLCCWEKEINGLEPEPILTLLQFYCGLVQDAKHQKEIGRLILETLSDSKTKLSDLLVIKEQVSQLTQCFGRDFFCCDHIKSSLLKNIIGAPSSAKQVEYFLRIREILDAGNSVFTQKIIDNVQSLFDVFSECPEMIETAFTLFLTKLERQFADIPAVSTGQRDRFFSPEPRLLERQLQPSSSVSLDSIRGDADSVDEENSDFVNHY